MDGAAAVLEQGRSKLLPGGAERNGIYHRAVARLQPSAYMSLAGLLHMGDRMGRERDHRLRITGTEWARTRKRRKQCRGRPSRRQGTIDQQGVVTPRCFDIR